MVVGKEEMIVKAQTHRRIPAIAAAVMIGIATTSGAAFARGGGGFGGGHMGGGFGGAHMGVVGGAHVGSFGAGHMGGLGVHPMDMPGVVTARGHGLGHTHASHELRDHHVRGLYGESPLYDNCSWPADLTIESCPDGLDAE
jgi:hypothetical protein